MSDNQVSLLLKIQTDLAELKALRSEFGSFIQEIGQGNVALSALGTGLSAGLGAGIGVAITKGLGSAIETIRESIGEVSNLSKEVERNKAALGISGEAYQVYSTILKAANQDVSALNPAMSRLSKLIGEAGAGSKPAVEALAAIGTTARELKDLSPERQFELIAQGLARITDANERDAAAAALLGKSYQNLKPLLEALARDGYGALTKKVDESAGILKDEYSKAIDDASTRSEQAGNRISVALAPVALRLKEMAAHSKEIFANLIADEKPAAAAQTPAGAGAANAAAQAKGKTPEEIEALLEKERATYEYIRDNPYSAETSLGMTADAYISVILARIDAFNAELATAKAKAHADDVAAEVQWEAGATGRMKGAEQRRTEQLEFEKRLHGDLVKVRGESNRDELQGRELKFGTEQAETARQVANVQGQIARIEADRFTTEVDKQTQIYPLLQKEHELLQSRIAALQEELRINNTLAPKDRQRISDRIDVLQKEDNGVVARGDKTQPLGTGSQISADLVQLENQLGTFSQNIGAAISGSIGSAVGSVGSGISQWILRAQTFRQAISNIGREVVTSLVTNLVDGFVKGLARMLIEYITTKGSMFAVDTLFAAKGLVLSAANAAKSLVMWLPSAIAASISSWGTAAAIGAAAVIAIVAANKFADGGMLHGPGTGRSDSMLARVSNGEYILKADSVQSIGPDLVDYMNRTGKLPGYAFGGLIGSDSVGGSGTFLQKLGMFLGNGGLPSGMLTKNQNNFQKKWNLLSGTQLYGQVDAGGQEIKPTADQLTAAKLAATGFDQSHLDYVSTLGGPISSGSSFASSAGSSSTDTSASQAPAVNVSVYAYTDRQQLMQDWRRDPSTKKMILDTLKNERGMIG